MVGNVVEDSAEGEEVCCFVDGPVVMISKRRGIGLTQRFHIRSSKKQHRTRDEDAQITPFAKCAKGTENETCCEENRSPWV